VGLTEQAGGDHATTGLDEVVSSIRWIECHSVVAVRVDSLVFEGSPRLDGEDQEHIRLLAESSDALPPITVHRPTMRVIDGVHRVRAALLNGIKEINARLLDCSEDVAFVLAVKANVTHGLPLSQPDRAAAAVRIIASHPHWSDRAVAAATGLSDKTISRIRGRSTETPQSNTRLGKDGRLRPLDSGTRRQRAAAMINDKPEAGLREVARATGLSAATVRDVRQRIDRGEDPVPGKYRPVVKASSSAVTAVAQPPLTPATSRTRRMEAHADRRKLLAKLRLDPSLRFNEAGRTALRWLHQHTLDAKCLESLYRGLPDHWAPVVASLARSCAAEWTMLAEQLEQRTA
jgi:ParB-like chromosome segregation protein Spo0J